MIKMKKKVKFKKTFLFFERIKHLFHAGYFDSYGKMGVDALSNATPVDTGLASSSWGYEVTMEKERVIIHFTNSDVENGVNVAIILQYGHLTRAGTWIEGIDYINPAIRPVFEQMCKDMWAEVEK